MTKTKVEANPESTARSSHHGRDGQDKACGDASSHQQSRQIHRHHVQHMTSKQPQANAYSKISPAPSQNKTKEIHSKKPKRGLSVTPNIYAGKKEMKPESRKRSESNRSKSSGRRKLSDGSITSDDLSKDSGCATGKLSSTDSSSEISDASEEQKQSTDAQCGEVCHGGTDEEMMDDLAEQISEHREDDDLISATLSPGFGFGEGSISPGDQRSYVSLDSRLNLSASVAFSDLTGDFTDGVHEDLLREIDDLRSENEYLKVRLID